MKRILSTIIMLALLIGTFYVPSYALETTPQANSTDYAAIYLEYLQAAKSDMNHPLNGSMGFIFLDLDKDNIPELLTYVGTRRRYDENGNQIGAFDEGYETAPIEIVDYTLEKAFSIIDGKVVEGTTWRYTANDGTSYAYVIPMAHLPNYTGDTELFSGAMKSDNGECFGSYYNMSGGPPQYYAIEYNNGKFSYSRTAIEDRDDFEEVFTKYTPSDNPVVGSYDSSSTTKYEIMKDILTKYKAAVSTEEAELPVETEEISVPSGETPAVSVENTTSNSGNDKPWGGVKPDWNMGTERARIINRQLYAYTRLRFSGGSLAWWPVLEGEKIVSVAQGQSHFLALTKKGTLYAWGDNNEGECGTGGTTWYQYNNPQEIMQDVVAIEAVDSTSMAITRNGDLYIWGNDNFGAAGNGEIHKTPYKILENVKDIDITTNYRLALLHSGEVYAWGGGSVGDGTDKKRKKPVKILDDAIAISAGGKADFLSNGIGGTFGAAIKSDGSLYMWGGNNRGQLGDGTKQASFSPKKIMDNVRTVDTGYEHTLAITNDGSLYAWGRYNYGQLEDHLIPEKLLDNAVSAIAGDHLSTALTADGNLYVWGTNDRNKINISTSSYYLYEAYTPQLLDTEVAALNVGEYEYYIKSNGDFHSIYDTEIIEKNVRIPDPTVVSVELDCRELAFDQPPIIENDRVLVPFRGICEAMGAYVEWNEATQQATAKLNGTELIFTIGQSYVLVNGQKVAIDQPPIIKNDRILLPVRAFAEKLGAKVQWDKPTYTVKIGQHKTKIKKAQLLYDSIEMSAKAVGTDGYTYVAQSAKDFRNMCQAAENAYKDAVGLEKFQKVEGLLITSVISVGAVYAGVVTATSAIASGIGQTVATEAVTALVKENITTADDFVYVMMKQADPNSYNKFAILHASIKRDKMTDEQAEEYIKAYYEMNINKDTYSLACTYFAEKFPNSFEESVIQSIEVAFEATLNTFIGWAIDNSVAQSAQAIANVMAGSGADLLKEVEKWNCEDITLWSNGIKSKMDELEEIYEDYI